MQVVESINIMGSFTERQLSNSVVARADIWALL